MSGGPAAAWKPVLEIGKLGEGGTRVVRREGKQILLVRGSGDDIQAVDNRCPHEGYPLKTGTIRDGVLTCEWHNWKFRLSDGACMLGGEDVRHYPAEVRDGQIWLDLSDPPPEEVAPRYEDSLVKAFDELDAARAARDVERLLDLGRAPSEVLAFACRWVAGRRPYGFDHGLAASADVAALLSRAGDQDTGLLFAGIWTAIEPQTRRPAREFPEPAAVPTSNGSPDEEAIGALLREHVEGQDAPGAEALLRGAIDAGVPSARVFDWLTVCATDHFLDFAHQHIYCVKAEELLEHIGWQHAHPVLTSLATGITYGTREDLLPYMRPYTAAMEVHLERMQAWFEQDPDPGAALEVEAFSESVLDGSLEDALAAVAGALDGRVGAVKVAEALAIAASRRILRFDPEIEQREDVKQSWLWVTHLLTHADAVRQSLLRHPSEEALRGLFHSARFINHVKVLDREGGAGDADDVWRDELDVPHTGDLLEEQIIHSCYISPLVRPIFWQHHIKTAMAAVRLYGAMENPEPLLACARFLAHPLCEQRHRQTAFTARAFVREGKLPGSLLPY